MQAPVRYRKVQHFKWVQALLDFMVQNEVWWKNTRANISLGSCTFTGHVNIWLSGTKSLPLFSPESHFSFFHVVMHAQQWGLSPEHISDVTLIVWVSMATTFWTFPSPRSLENSALSFNHPWTQPTSQWLNQTLSYFLTPLSVCFLWIAYLFCLFDGIFPCISTLCLTVPLFVSRTFYMACNEMD